MKTLVRTTIRLAATFLMLGLAISGNAQGTAVLTRAFDNLRSGANTHETTLTRDSVLARGIRRITTIPVVGDARGMEAQPLILPAVKLKDRSVHDVMILPSMANVVRGVDAQTGAALWQVTLCRPIQGGASIDFHNINDKWGVLSTPVIDPETQRVYMVAWCSGDGSPQAGVHFIYDLNIADGSEAAAPLSLAGQRSGNQTYSSAMRKQRSSLVLATVAGSKTVVFASGTVLEVSNGAAGWIFALDCRTNTLTSLALSQGLGAGVWMAGQGLAFDGSYFYGITGNGSFDGASDFGESFIKIQYQPPTAISQAWLRVVGWWSPYSDSARIGGNPQLSAPTLKLAPGKLAGASAVSEAVKMQMPVGSGMDVPLAGAKLVRSGPTTETGSTATLVYPLAGAGKDAAWNDEDLGSGGITCVGAYRVCLVSGKDGIGYVVRMDHPGNTQPADFADMKANCARLASPPVWLTASPGPVDPCPQDTTTLNFLPWGKTRHLHMTPVQYQRPAPFNDIRIFVWGENSTLHAWGMSPSGNLTYLAQGNEVASATVQDSPGGMPGGFCTLSSNNNALGTALLWCTVPYGDANATITVGRLLCYDPETFITNQDGTKTLRVLWDSERWGIQFVFNKFDPPIVADGKVYVPNYNGGVDVYGN